MSGVVVVTIFGSSPRVRGTVTWCAANAVVKRFIPARAGNRGAKVVVVELQTVHPRACGEQVRRVV